MRRVFLALTITLVLGCISQNPRAPAQANLLEPHDFRDYIRDDSIFLLDVFNGEHALIPGTDAHIPYDQLAEKTDLLPSDKSTPIAVYCRLNPMSAKGSQTLLELGYSNVTKLRGGTTNWKKQGYSLTANIM